MSVVVAALCLRVYRVFYFFSKNDRILFKIMAHPRGFEPLTSAVRRQRSVSSELRVHEYCYSRFVPKSLQGFLFFILK
jgi:hypothetical protein